MRYVPKNSWQKDIPSHFSSKKCAKKENHIKKRTEREKNIE